MELIRGHYNLRPRHRGCVATIGNFDGLHLGHRALLARMLAEADARGLPSTLITFEPHPQEFFNPGDRPARLTSFREKYEVLACRPIDRLLCLPFNRSLARMPAAAFIEQVLVGALGVRCLVVGEDFRFGHRRQGDVAMLRAAGRRATPEGRADPGAGSGADRRAGSGPGFGADQAAGFGVDQGAGSGADQWPGFDVVAMGDVESAGERVSSTRIRAALRSGDLALAARLLGRPYRLAGPVVAGDRRGRELGFPTANVHLKRRAWVRSSAPHAPPLAGVFAVRVFGVASGGQPLDGVANIGTRPTVDGSHCRLEVHLFDFDGDLYGRHIQVEFHARLREERRFESLDALAGQIARDARRAREWFAAHAAGVPVAGEA